MLKIDKRFDKYKLKRSFKNHELNLITIINKKFSSKKNDKLEITDFGCADGKFITLLEKSFQTEKKISSFHKKEKKKRDFEIIKIGIKTEREDLYKKINNRVDKMINDGLIEEASTLFKHRDLNALNTVGYKEIFNYLDKNNDVEDTIEEIKKNTRRFAKRQLTWFRKDSTINWFLKSEKNKIIDFILK